MGDGRIDVMHEHRGTLICTAVPHELKPALEATAEKDRPIAAGGNPEGDHSFLASLLVQMVLLGAGWEAVNLGPHTPLASFRLALSELKPRMMWLSASYLPDPHTFLDEYREFYKEAEDAGVAVAIGGRAIHGSLRRVDALQLPRRNLTDLAAFAADAASAAAAAEARAASEVNVTLPFVVSALRECHARSNQC